MGAAGAAGSWLRKSAERDTAPKCGPVHPHNQVILATHRTLITTINDSPPPPGEPLRSFPARRGAASLASSLGVADSSVKARPTAFRRSTVIGINDSFARAVPRCCLRPFDEQKSMLARSPEGDFETGRKQRRRHLGITGVTTD